MISLSGIRSWIHDIRLHLGKKGIRLALIKMVSSLILGASEYLVALVLVMVLFVMGLVDRSMLPKWYPSQQVLPSPWVIWFLLLVVALLRSGCQLVSRHSGHALLELVRARLKMSEAYRLLILEKETSLFISRMNTHLAEIIPRASDYVYATTGLVATALQTAALGLGMVFLAWRETVVGIICLAIVAGIVAAFGRKLRKMGALIPPQHQRFEKILVRISRNWLLIRILKLNHREYNQYMDSVYDYYRISRNTFLLKNIALTIPPFLGIMSLAIIILSSLEFFHTYPIQLVAFIYLFIRFTQSLVQITDLTTTLHQFSSQFCRSSRLLAKLSKNEIDAALKPSKQLLLFREIKKEFPDIPKRISGQTTHKDNELPVPKIELNQISFTWPGMSQPLFKNITLKIEAGTRFGIIGPNGSGKSTMLGIILGVIPPDSGSVYLNGMDPSYYISAARSIGFVGEEPFLLEGTVRDNLTYGLEEEIADEILWNTLKTVGLEKVIHTTGKGLEYHIGEKGEGLSAGEQQKLSLARALLRQPKLLVLDEASSNIDPRSEAEIASILKKWGNTCTILIVSHKPGILKAAEKIIDMASLTKPFSDTDWDNMTV